MVAVLVRLLLGRRCPPTLCKLSNSLERRDLPPLARAAFGWWLRLHGRFIERFVGMAEPMRAEIERCLEVDRQRIDIIRRSRAQGVRTGTASHKSERQPSGVRRFVAIGRMNAQKNFQLLMRAFAGFAEANDRLLIVGDGPERSRLLELSEELGIADRVSMPGHAQSVAEALATADVFVMSSDYEGVPAVIIEALAAGVPIVATDCSVSMNYLLEDGAFGTLVPISDPAALAGRDARRARALQRSGGCDARQGGAVHDRAGGGSLSRRFERGSEVGDQVVGILEPDVQPHQVRSRRFDTVR